MVPSIVKDIENAIQRLNREEMEELYAWLEEHFPQRIDVQLEADLSAGRLDATIDRALDDEKRGRIKPL